MILNMIILVGHPWLKTGKTKHFKKGCPTSGSFDFWCWKQTERIGIIWYSIKEIGTVAKSFARENNYNSCIR